MLLSQARGNGTSAWQTLVTPEGVIYYHNSASGQTQWDKPAELKDDSDIEREVRAMGAVEMCAGWSGVT